MKCEFQWIPPSELGDWWPTIKEGLFVVQEKAPGGWKPNDIFLEIAGGHSHLHLVMQKKYYKGFLISKVLDTLEGRKILLWIAYSHADEDILTENISQIHEWAQKIGAVKIQFQSPRKGWEKVGARIGFKPVQVIYEAEVEKENP